MLILKTGKIPASGKYIEVCRLCLTETPKEELSPTDICHNCIDILAQWVVKTIKASRGRFRQPLWHEIQDIVQGKSINYPLEIEKLRNQRIKEGGLEMVKNTTTIGELAELIKQYQQVEAELKRTYDNRRKLKQEIITAFRLANLNYFITEDQSVVLIDRNDMILIEPQLRG
uniref:Uncharacterized protein n=1 Tax=viral metagenome TaxID=1070528 RepID=A0A6H2A4Q9_9ZZZZ